MILLIFVILFGSIFFLPPEDFIKIFYHRFSQEKLNESNDINIDNSNNNCPLQGDHQLIHYFVTTFLFFCCSCSCFLLFFFLFFLLFLFITISSLIIFLPSHYINPILTSLLSILLNAWV